MYLYLFFHFNGVGYILSLYLYHQFSYSENPFFIYCVLLFASNRFLSKYFRRFVITEFSKKEFFFSLITLGFGIDFKLFPTRKMYGFKGRQIIRIIRSYDLRPKIHCCFYFGFICCEFLVTKNL